MGAIRCPFFHCTNVKRNGVRNGRQRYTCLTCSRSWSSKHRPARKIQKLWHQYAFEGRTVASLAKETMLACAVFAPCWQPTYHHRSSKSPAQ